MITDAQQTKMLREARLQEKRSIKELNNIGKRLMWVREKLELTQREVCESTGLPASSYCGRECGIRPELAEEFVVLAMFFNKLWKAKFKGPDYPQFNGQEIKKIGTEWLMFGHSDLEANAEAIIEEYQIKIRELEEEYFMKEAMLLKQLDMFKLEDV
jgi:transcriptional regulator with XRE-family HTH domain